MSHIVYCWEMGGGMGHMLPLARIAAALQARGHTVTCIVSDMQHAPGLLGRHGIMWLPAPRAGLTAAAPRPLNHADILHGVGYDSATRLLPLVTAWRNMFGLLRPDRVISDYAPTARLAALSMDLPVTCIDSGFAMPPLPPPFSPLPALGESDAPTLLALEQRTLDVVNAVLASLKRPGLPRFAALFEQATWYRNWCEFNHFGPHSPDRHLGQMLLDSGGAEPAWPDGNGKKLFAYLKPGHPGSEAVLDAAMRMGYRILAYLPGFPRHVIQRLGQGGRIVVSAAPVRLTALEDDVDVAIWHSPTGSVGHCLVKGMRMLYLPMQIEQHLACRAIERAGVPVRVAGSNESWRDCLDQVQTLPRAEAHDRWQPLEIPRITDLLLQA